MAGIGFELRKLFNEKDKAFSDVKARAYSSIVSVGPWIMTCLSLNIIVYLGNSLERAEKVTYSSAILYAFIFSQLLTGPFQYLITRYVADCIFSKNPQKIRSAYIGVIKIIMVLSFFMSYFFIRGGDFSGNFKACYVVLFVVMSMLWITMIFVSILKSYMFMIKSFFCGNLISIAGALIFIKYPVTFFNETLIFWMLFSYTIGIFINFLFTSTYVLKAFKGENISNFDFLNCTKKYFSFFLIGFFYIFGVWGHVIVNWMFGDAYIVGNVFLVSPLYEVAIFYAFCTTMPSMVYSIIFLETKFYPVYKNYYEKILHSGNYKEVNVALTKMHVTLTKELFYCMELQLLISLTFILTANVVFDYLRVDLYLLDIFRVSILSAYCVVFISIFITVFFYFDARKYAIITGSIFFGGGLLFSYIFGQMGSQYVGLGFFSGSFLAFTFAIFLYKRIFNSLNYTTMFRMNFSNKPDSPFLKKVDEVIGKKLYLAGILLVIIFFGGCTNYNNAGFNTTTKRNWHTMGKYDKSGYDYGGLNEKGLDKRGFDSSGWNEYTKTNYDYYGFDKKNIHKDTGKLYDERGFNYLKQNLLTNSNYDKNGFDYEGLHKETKTQYDKNGWNYYGLNEKTQGYYDVEGYSQDGYDKEGYNKSGYTEKGIDRRGFDKIGINAYTKSQYDYGGFSRKNIHKDTGKNYDEKGFDYKGYNVLTNSNFDLNGFSYKGIHRDTKTQYDKNGWNYYGFNGITKSYYDKRGYSINGLDRDGYTRDNRPADIGPPPLEDYKEKTNGSGDNGPVDKDGFNKAGVYIGGN